MFQSPHLKYHVQTIGIDQSLSNNALYEHKCLENIKKLYRYARKCEYQKQFKDILEATIISTPEGFTNDGAISPVTSTSVKKPSSRKSLCLFTHIFYVKKKTATRQIGDAKSKRKAIKYGTTPW